MTPIRAPLVLPLPVGAQTIASGASVTLQVTGSPLYLVMTVPKSFWSWLGINTSVTCTTQSAAPHNLGVYGPNPGNIGPPWGRSRAPKLGLPDGTSNSCTNNLPGGTYYLVLRNGTDGAPLVPITVTVK